MKVAPTKYREKESAKGMERSLLVKNKYSGGNDTHTMIKRKGLVLLYTWGNKKEQCLAANDGSRYDPSYALQ